MNSGYSKRDKLIIIAMIAAFSILFRVMYAYRFQTSALLYVGFPAAISVLLLLYTRKGSQERWAIRYWNHTRSALIVMLGSSIVLFEGFLCVLMFMPIYFGVMAVCFLIEFCYRKTYGNSGGTVSVHLLPAILLLSMLEGVTPTLSFDRMAVVSVAKVVPLSTDDIWQGLQEPMELGDNMPGFLSLFPMPYKIEAESLIEGDIHRSHFRYHRWFVANTHEGFVELSLEEVSEEQVFARITHDSSYFSNYLTMHSIAIGVKAVSESETEVTLSVKYERKLDPAWYFSPLQKFGVAQAASYLIDQLAHRAGSKHSG